MTSPVPKKMVLGAALGIIGGIIGIAAMSMAWDGTLESMTAVGMGMLVSCMFFAVGGAFTKYTPVQGSTILVLAAACEAVVALSVLYEAAPFWMNLVLLVIGAVNILFAACPHVQKWVDTARI